MNYDNLKDELMAIADTALKTAKSLDSSAEYEVFVYFESSLEVSINQGVVTAKDGIVRGNAVRVSKGKQVGFSSSSGIAPKRITRSIEEALSIINSLSVEDERFNEFCDPTPSGKDGVLADGILELGTPELISANESMIEDAKSVDPRISFTGGGAGAWWGGYAIASSRGVLAGSVYGGNGCEVNVQAIEGEERRAGYTFDYSRERLYDPAGLGEKAAKDAVALLGGKKLDLTEKMPTIWSKEPASFYILSSLGRAVLGEPVVDKISPLCDMIGDTIADSQLTIIDDGQNPKGLGTNAVDHEGLAQRTNPLIENGVLKGFLFNSYFGGAFGVDSTGNCARGGGPFGGPVPYETSPGVATKWLNLTPGTKTREELIASIDQKAILIEGFPLGIFHTNVSTGEFSVVAGEVYLIENGEVKYPLQPVSIAGSFYEGFKNVIGIGSDKVTHPWGISCPSIAFDGFSVTG